MMRFSTTALLLLLPAIGSALEFGGDTIYNKDMHNHEWCCKDAGCVDSCLSGDADGNPFLQDGSPTTLPQVNQLQEFYTYQGKTYTLIEVYLNAEGIAEIFCSELFNYNCLKGGSAVRDPHFKTWASEWYDFHGECDLVWMNAPQFGKGVGLDVHIRTKIKHGYSFIESAALKIGDDILEVSSYGDYQINGIQHVDIAGAGIHLGPYQLVHTTTDDDHHSFDIITEGQQVLQVQTFKDFVDVKVENVNMEDFMGSKGMLGAYPSGSMMARDATILEDPNEFGQEWQVTAEEPKLFQVERSPQLSRGEKCIMPNLQTAETRRRLGESQISRPEAEKACSHFKDKASRDMCIFDVIATGDLDMAQAGGY